jgi:predicted nuclease of predicted toxin-antitoxin system
VRFLVDANVSPRLAKLLRAGGHDALAVRDVGLGDAPDDDILDHAAAEDRIVISHDTDFGTLVAFRQLSKPSFVLIRSSDPLTPEEQAAMLIANLDGVAEDLEAGGGNAAPSENTEDIRHGKPGLWWSMAVTTQTGPYPSPPAVLGSSGQRWSRVVGYHC